MESISAENQVLKNQLMAINTQAAYFYYYNSYVGYSAGTSAGGWQQATPYYPQGVRNIAHSPVAPMQPLSTPGNTPMGNERRAQQRQPVQGSDSRRCTTPTRRSTPDLPPPPEGPVPPEKMKVEEMMRSFMSEEMRTFEAHMEQRFSSQIHRATTSTPGSMISLVVSERRLLQSGLPTPSPQSLSMNIPAGMLDDMLCKLFTQSLKRAALRWFCNLPPKSIDSFDELSLEVMRRPHESLHAYIKRFSKAISEISGLDDGTVREALKKGLRHKSLFKNEICARYPPTIQDAMHRAKGFIELEEENERADRDLARMREKVAKAHDDLSELIAHLKHQDFITGPKKLPENPARDTTKYCEFYKDPGHQTIDCRALRAEVAELLKKGHLREFLTEKGIETYGLSNESKERRIV
ncbi:hypothetical protein TIFTF001_029207 [Ficus carica]|uniref:Retrotransposon gag domain-containing protein n=1 Tax=Ficus carica TaxID=3494 RepID=A0AA88DR63_FICCA|nr:hypothetical protein TIFTF001_029207 [Ficus carica]